MAHTSYIPVYYTSNAMSITPQTGELSGEQNIFVEENTASLMQIGQDLLELKSCDHVSNWFSMSIIWVSVLKDVFEMAFLLG